MSMLDEHDMAILAGFRAMSPQDQSSAYDQLTSVERKHMELLMQHEHDSDGPDASPDVFNGPTIGPAKPNYKPAPQLDQPDLSLHTPNAPTRGQMYDPQRVRAMLNGATGGMAKHVVAAGDTLSGGSMDENLSKEHKIYSEASNDYPEQGIVGGMMMPGPKGGMGLAGKMATNVGTAGMVGAANADPNDPDAQLHGLVGGAALGFAGDRAPGIVSGIANSAENAGNAVLARFLNLDSSTVAKLRANGELDGLMGVLQEHGLLKPNTRAGALVQANSAQQQSGEELGKVLGQVKDFDPRDVSSSFQEATNAGKGPLFEGDVKGPLEETASHYGGRADAVSASELHADRSKINSRSFTKANGYTPQSSALADARQAHVDRYGQLLNDQADASGVGEQYADAMSNYGALSEAKKGLEQVVGNQKGAGSALGGIDQFMKRSFLGPAMSGVNAASQAAESTVGRSLKEIGAAAKVAVMSEPMNDAVRSKLGRMIDLVIASNHPEVEHELLSAVDPQYNRFMVDAGKSGD